MLSPLKPLLCRHDFYWSERHGSDRCRRCGKLRAAEAFDVVAGEPFAGNTTLKPVVCAPLTLNDQPAFPSAKGVFVGFDGRKQRSPLRSPALIRPSAKVLRAQARERREMLLGLLERLAQGSRPTREEAIDAVLAVIEDAHSAEPVLFGADAAGHFARLLEARSAPQC